MDLIELLKRPEGKTLELKRDLSSPQGVLKTIVAFANTAGGTLLIGVEDGGRHVRGVAKALDVEERLASLLSDGVAPEKQILRAAFDGWLPDDLLWRDKSQFGDGSGAASVLTDTFTDSIGEEELAAERDAVDPPLRTREELAYYRIFQQRVGEVRPERTLGRFATA